MKKIFASASLVALGATVANTAVAADSMGGATADKPWDVSLAVRGFYDDNYNTAPNGSPAKNDTFGVEVRPSLGAAWRGDQTSFGGHYTYSMRYYEARPNGNIDHAHDFNAWLQHRISERFSFDVADTFTVAQEPAITDPTLATVTRTQGDNIHNNGNFQFHARLTRSLELVLGYKNDLYQYDQKGLGSLSANLDRMEQLANANLIWQFRRETAALIGYGYGWGEYNSDDLIAVGFPSSIKDYRSHLIYAGLQHNFMRNLVGTIKAGAQMTDQFNANQDSTTPWTEAKLSYNYGPDSSLSIGVNHARNATDIFSTSATSVTTDQETTTVFGEWHHAITPRLIGTLTGQYQNAVFEGGASTVDGQADDIYLLGVSAEYRFTRHLSAEIGYNYDRVESNILGRGYDRNRVFVGMNVTY